MYTGELLVLYADQLSPDGIKAIVLDTNSFFHNISQLNFTLEDSSVISLAESINGTSIIPAGRYLCMIIRSPDNSKASPGMIILDIKDKEEIAKKMANKFENKLLKEKFMKVYYEILNHPENHELFTLILGKPLASSNRNAD